MLTHSTVTRPTANTLQRSNSHLQVGGESDGQLETEQEIQEPERQPPLLTQPNYPFAAASIFPARSAIIQPKLMLGGVGDQYEQEADRVAEQVTQQTDLNNRLGVTPNNAGIFSVQGQVSHPTIQRRLGNRDDGIIAFDRNGVEYYLDGTDTTRDVFVYTLRAFDGGAERIVQGDDPDYRWEDEKFEVEDDGNYSEGDYENYENVDYYQDDLAEDYNEEDSEADEPLEQAVQHVVARPAPIVTETQPNIYEDEAGSLYISVFHPTTDELLHGEENLAGNTLWIGYISAKPEGSGLGSVGMYYAANLAISSGQVNLAASSVIYSAERFYESFGMHWTNDGHFNMVGNAYAIRDTARAKAERKGWVIPPD